MDPLTEEQKEQLREYCREWDNFGISTEPIDEKKAREAINLLYEMGESKPPKEILFFSSPPAMIKHFKENLAKPDNLPDVFFGNVEAPWVGMYEFFRTKMGRTDLDKIKGLVAIVKDCGPLIVTDEVALVCDRPKEIHFNDANQLHNTEGPAVAWRDGYKVYCWRGIQIQEWIIERPEEITAEKIFAESNAEIRRIMVEKKGHENIFNDPSFKGQVINEAVLNGRLIKLWKAEIPNDEALQVIEVINATAEPSTGPNGEMPGSWHKKYYLRVPPDQTDAIAAAAWTFNMTKEQYLALEVET